VPELCSESVSQAGKMGNGNRIHNTRNSKHRDSDMRGILSSELGREFNTVVGSPEVPEESQEAGDAIL